MKGNDYMSNVWERFEGMEGTSPDEVAQERAKFEPLEEGTYKVELERWTDEFGEDHVLQAGESQSGNPMVKGRLRIQEGERKGSMIFYNQLIQVPNYPSLTARNIGLLTTFLSGVLGERIEFTGLGDLADLVSRVEEGIKFTVELSYDAKDVEKKYPRVEVVGREVDNEDMPF